MLFDKPVRRIAVVGTGAVGASWASLYLARGFDVIATDPARNAEADLRRYIDTACSTPRRPQPAHARALAAVSRDIAQAIDALRTAR